MDAQGIIQAKYEGGITFAEMEPALKAGAAGQPVHLPPQPHESRREIPRVSVCSPLAG